MCRSPMTSIRGFFVVEVEPIVSIEDPCLDPRRWAREGSPRMAERVGESIARS